MTAERAHETTADLDPAVLWRLLDVTRDLSGPVELSALLSKVIDAAREVLHADRASVLLYDRSTDELFAVVATGNPEIRFPANRGIAGECAQRREIINVPDCYADSRFNREIDRRTGYRTRCLLAIPLIGHDEQLVGVLQVLNKSTGVFTQQDEQLALVLGAQCAVALQRARLIEEQLVKQKLQRDLSIAQEIQQGVFPSRTPQVPGYEVAGWSQPADETGGDMYDVAEVGEGLFLLLADATGHGIGPALSVTQLRSMCRIALRLETDLDGTALRVNDQLEADLSENRFITAFLGRLDPHNHRVEYHAGGQAPLLVFRASTGECEWLPASTLPLGILPGVDLGSPEPIHLEPGDMLGLISDGVYETQNDSRTQFGQERVGEVVRNNHDRPLSDVIEAIRAAVVSFRGSAEQDDDMTALLVRRAAHGEDET